MLHQLKNSQGLFIVIGFFFALSLVVPLSCMAQSNDSGVEIMAGVTDELFPVIAKQLADGNEQFNLKPVVMWKLRNQSDEPKKITLVAEIPQWTPQCITTITLNPRETTFATVTQNPFGPNLLKVKTLFPATLSVKAIINGEIVFQETKNIKIRAAGDMIWGMQAPFDSAYMIAAWVTPNDPFVEQILGLARKKWSLRSKALSGYAGSDITAQIRAIFDAVRSVGIGYVDSRVTFGQVGQIQRVRLPGESVQQRAANCIDGAVLFASLFENIGLDPVIVLVPNHAFVGVKIAQNSNQTIFIETTMVGRSKFDSFKTGEFTYDAAAKEGTNKYINAFNASRSDKEALHVIDIKKARAMGIHPLW
jgi:hypothetical protein